MKLYQYAVLFHEQISRKAEDDGQRPVHKIIVDPAFMLAKDDKEALILASRRIPAEYENRLSEVEIALRPF